MMAALNDLLPVALVAGGGLVAWGEMRSKVNGIRKDVEGKAEKDVVEVKFDSIIERLARMETKLDRNSRGD